MNAAKIRLSPEERELVMNAGWILTKNNILQKINRQLGELQSAQQEYLQNFSQSLPAAIMNSSPKISKGENYKGLPYLILDYPKYFDQSAVFAIRTMFWWGNFFSTTLHLAGTFKEEFQEKIIAAFPLWQENGFCCCVHQEQWEHHFEPGNYKPVAELSTIEFGNQIRNKSFCKIAKKIPLDNWDELPGLLLTDYKLLVTIAGK